MALTDLTLDDIKDDLENDGFPLELLADGTIQKAMDRALNDYQEGSPILKATTFNTIAGQNTYDLFSEGNPESIDPTGLFVTELLWSQGYGSSESVDPFGAYANLYMSTGYAGFGSYPNFSFDTPSDYSTFAENLAKWQNRFSGNYINTSSEPGSPIVLTPTPQVVTTAFIVYAALRPADTNSQALQDAYLLLVESRCANVLKRIFSQTAGLMLGSFRDSTKADKDWGDESDRLRVEAISKIGGFNFASLTAATRS